MSTAFVIGPTFNFKRAAAPRGTGLESSGGVKGSRVIAGYASVFGNVDAGSDVVLPGAFKQAVMDFNAGVSRCRFLWNHDMKSPPIAQILEIQEVPRERLPGVMSADPTIKGALKVIRQYFTDDFSDRVYQGVASKAISEMSFAFDVLDYEYETVKGQKVRLLKRLQLMDVSDVNFGMNPATMASVPKGAIVLTAEKIDRLKRQKQDQQRRMDAVKQLKYKPGYRSPNLVIQSAKLTLLRAQCQGLIGTK